MAAAAAAAASPPAGAAAREKSIQITEEKVALMPGIAAYVYTKSGNLSSYGRRHVCVSGGGGAWGAPPLIEAVAIEAVAIDWLGGVWGPLQAANEARGQSATNS